MKCRLFKTVKRKTKEARIGAYIRELSVVIIGVAVTFLISDTVSTAKEKKDLNQQLNAIYIELELNLEKVNQLVQLYDSHIQLGRLLRQTITEPEQVSEDSLRKYIASADHMDLFIYNKSAFEMFVINGGMKLISDRRLLLDISESYAMLEAASRESELYNSLKLREIQELYKLDPKRFVNRLAITEPENKGLFNFYMGVATGFKSKEAKKQIEKVLENRKQK